MSTTMKQLKQSETLTINRSQINLNPYNPKRHTDKEIKNQLANLKKVGFNGGIKWNKVTKNLIDGHRRIKAMDIYYKYDGTNETDYQVKVEAVGGARSRRLQKLNKAEEEAVFKKRR